MFDWAQFQRTKGAIKLHLLLDHAGYLPSFAVITTGKTHDLRVARQLEFEPGTVLVFDRGYIDYQWFVELSRRQVYFVTRLKENAVYEVVERRAVPQGSNVVADEVIFFSRQAEASPELFFPTGGDRRSRAGALGVSDQPSQAGGDDGGGDL